MWLSPCVSVIIGDKRIAHEIERAIHDALRDDPRYLFITLTGDGYDPGWKLAIQWGVGEGSRTSPEIRLSAGEHSPASVVRRVRQNLATLDEAPAS